METKTCTICNETLPLTSYHKNQRNAATPQGAVRSCCKSCFRSTRSSRSHVRKTDFFNYLAISKRSAAKKYSIQYDLTKEYLKSLWEYQKCICPVLGIKLDLLADNMADEKANLDRIIPHLGYTKGNVMFISSLANRVKSNCTDPEVFLKVSEYVANNNKQEQPEFDFSFPN